MITMIERALLALLVGQAPVEGTAAASTWIWLLGALLVVAAGVIVWAVPRTRALATQIDNLNSSIEEGKGESRKLGEKTRKQDKGLEGKRDEITKLKKDLAGQRKKNHTAQEENKKLRGELNDQRSSFKKKLTNRPAFADEEKVPAPVKAKPEAPKEEKPKERIIEQPRVAPSDDTSRVEEANLKLKNELKELRDETRGDRADLKRLRRRVEDYRRIDIINAGKRESLEERVKHLGRQYYEAVTEIAVLKGEVPAIPAPEELPDFEALARKKKDRKRGGEANRAAAADTDAKTDATTGADTDTEAAAEAATEAATATATGTNTETSAEAATGADTDIGTDTATDTDIGTDTATDAATAADTDTPTDAVTEPEAPSSEQKASGTDDAEPKDAKAPDGDAEDESGDGDSQEAVLA